MNIDEMKMEDRIRFETQLDAHAKKNMKQWDLNEFKRVFPRLYRTIIESIGECVKKEIEK